MALVAACDLTANCLAVWAYEYTTVASAMLLGQCEVVRLRLFNMDYGVDQCGPFETNLDKFGSVVKKLWSVKDECVFFQKWVWAYEYTMVASAMLLGKCEVLRLRLLISLC
jgi:hypothetical protein